MLLRIDLVGAILHIAFGAKIKRSCHDGTTNRPYLSATNETSLSGSYDSGFGVLYESLTLTLIFLIITRFI